MKFRIGNRNGTMHRYSIKHIKCRGQMWMEVVWITQKGKQRSDVMCRSNINHSRVKMKISERWYVWKSCKTCRINNGK
jgi:hypothetical protein